MSFLLVCGPSFVRCVLTLVSSFAICVSTYFVLFSRLPVCYALHVPCCVLIFACFVVTFALIRFHVLFVFTFPSFSLT